MLECMYVFAWAFSRIYAPKKWWFCAVVHNKRKLFEMRY